MKILKDKTIVILFNNNSKEIEEISIDVYKELKDKGLNAMFATTFNGGVVEYGILKETGLEEDRKIELSMDEIAQKFGVAVKDLNIKKD